MQQPPPTAQQQPPLQQQQAVAGGWGQTAAAAQYAAAQQGGPVPMAMAAGAAVGAAGGEEQARNLWIGDLQYWMDENYLWNCFAHTNEVQTVKIIRNKATGASEGYGFVEFATHATALHVLQTYSGAQMPQTEQPFRINWASLGTGGERSGGGGGGASGPRQPEGPEHSIFVGDLANDVTDYILTETFRTRYASVKAAKVVVDNATGRSKGYGFVRFTSEEERDRALHEMNGAFCSARPMRISIATPRRSAGGGGMGGGGPGGGPGGGGPGGRGAGQQSQGEDDPNNTTIFVGGLDQSVTDDQLRAAFGPYGELIYVKIPIGKGCGFVQYANRASAESALYALHGTVIGNQAVRLSWGRNPSAKQRAAYQSSQGWQQQQQQPQQQQQHDPYASANYYGAGAGAGYAAGGYDASAGAYGAAAAADPNAAYGYSGYGAASPYGGYAGYQQQTPQQQQPQQWPPQAGAVPAASAPAPGPAAPSAAPVATAPYGGGSSGGTAGSSYGGSTSSIDIFDPTQPPNIDKLNAQFMAKHDNGFLTQQTWLKLSDPSLVPA